MKALIRFVVSKYTLCVLARLCSYAYSACQSELAIRCSGKKAVAIVIFIDRFMWIIQSTGRREQAVYSGYQTHTWKCVMEPKKARSGGRVLKYMIIVCYGMLVNVSPAPGNTFRDVLFLF